MNIVILGAGAMGSFFGGLLAKNGNQVTLVDVNETHVDAIKERGLIIEVEGESERIQVDATTNAKEVSNADLVILFCKYPDTESALSEAMAYIEPRTYIWTLQNGIGNIEKISKFVEEDKIVKGLTSATSIIQGPGHVSTNFKGKTETYYWPLSGVDNQVLSDAAEALSTAGLPTFLAPDIDYRIWRKLVINSALTVISGFNNTRIGDAYFNDPGRELCEKVVMELVDVAQASGIPLELEDALSYLEQLANSAVDHVGSTTISLQLKERTEVDTMNGAIVRAGKIHNIPTPVNETIVQIVKLIEETATLRLSPSI